MNEISSLNTDSQKNSISSDETSQGLPFDQLPWEILRDVILPALPFSSLLNFSAASPSLNILDLVKEREQSYTTSFIQSLRVRITNDLSEEDQNALLALEDDESILSSTTLEEVQTSILNIKNKLLSILPSLSLKRLNSLEKDQSVDAPLNSYRPRYCKNIFDLAIMQRKIDEATQNNASPQELEALYEEILRKAAPEDRNDIDSEWMLEAIKIALKLPAALIYLKQIIRTYVERGHGPVVDIESLSNTDSALGALFEIYLHKGLLDQAQETRNQISDNTRKDITCVLLIQKYLERDAFNKVDVMINQIKDSFDKDKACVLLIQKHLERDEFDQAQEMINQIENSFDKDKAYLLYIQKHLERDEFDQAQEMINQIKDSFDKDKAYLLYIQKRLEMQRLERDEFEQAQSMINQIETRLNKEQAYLLLMPKCLERGAFNKVYEMINQIENSFDQDKARLLFIKKCLERGEFEQAKAMMNRIIFDFVKDKACVLLIQKHLERDEFDQAQEMINQIENSFNQDKARLLFIKKCLERGEFEQAKAMMNRIIFDSVKDKALELIEQA